jgi:hypothetical protein
MSDEASFREQLAAAMAVIASERSERAAERAAAEAARAAERATAKAALAASEAARFAEKARADDLDSRLLRAAAAPLPSLPPRVYPFATAFVPSWINATTRREGAPKDPRRGSRRNFRST